MTGPDYETVTITDDFVTANVAPSQEARCWCFAETDDGDGYWFPCRLNPADVEDRDAVPDPDVLPGDAVLQYPLESRGPETMTEGCPECGAKLVAVHGLPGYAACSDEDCDLYNVAFQPDGGK